MNKVLVLGYFGNLTNQLDGQTVKTRDVYRLAKEQLTDCDIEYFDTQSLHKSKPYIVEEGVNGFLFDPEKPEAIADAINNMVNLTYEERQEMGKRNRQLCLERNTEDAFLKSYVELIEKL